MINLAMVVEYDGSRFNGFQKQARVHTIQASLEEALTSFAASPVEIVVSGRTDTGVHALYQIINFKTAAKRELHKWVCGVNSLLPKDIVVKDIAVVADEFNARFAAVRRTYHYYLLLTSTRPAILYSKVGWYHGELDIELMQEALERLIGQRDFSSFRAANCQAKNPIRDLTNAKLTAKNNGNETLLRFEFTANAFLYHMIRNIVGALVYVGNGKLSLSDFDNIVNACDRRLAPPTFMADGLYLVNVEYNDQTLRKPNLEWIF